MVKFLLYTTEEERVKKKKKIKMHQKQDFEKILTEMSVKKIIEGGWMGGNKEEGNRWNRSLAHAPILNLTDKK